MTASLTPGALVENRYRVKRLIGQGGFGAVYEAVDERLKRRVALKQLLHAGDRLSRQFEREAQLLANLEHPALPNVSDHFATPDGQFLVMQYVRGDDLGSLLLQRDSPFPVDHVLAWGDQILDALHYLHTRRPPIIHRDIKPQNLKLTPDGTIMLLDFGLAKGFAGEVTHPRTESSLLAYTKGYAPPEQVQGLGTDARSDLYALGATLHCLLTNVPPLEAHWRLLATERGQPDPLRPAHERNSEVPKAVSRVLEQALALEPDARPQRAQTMRGALQAARAGRPASRQPAGAPIPMNDSNSALVDLPARVHFHPVQSRAVPDQVRAATQLRSGVRRTKLWWMYGGTATLLMFIVLMVATTVDGRVGGAPILPVQNVRGESAQSTPVAEPTVMPSPSVAPSPTVALPASSTNVAQVSDPALPAQTSPRTAVPSPQPTMVDQAHPSSSVVYAETFDAPGSRWFVGPYETATLNGRIAIEDGVHRWEATFFKDVTWWLRPTIEPVADFDLSVNMQRREGPAQSSYGVVFRLQEDEGFRYYRFRITDEQRFELSLWDRGTVTVLQEWTDSAAVAADGGNRLTVQATGSRFTLLINGQVVGEASDETLDRGQVGIIIAVPAGETGKFESDNLELRIR